MLKESQEKYLANFPDDRTVVVKPFDPKVQETAKGIISNLEKILPGLAIHFGGAAALGIAGQNDIDINILSTPQDYERYSSVLDKVYGEPVRRGTSIKWEFGKNGFDVELYLTDKNSPNLQDQIKVFDILSASKELREKYEQIKMPLGIHLWKDYMRRKYEFFNEILGQ